MIVTCRRCRLIDGAIIVARVTIVTLLLLLLLHSLPCSHRGN
jgi:hypothetical protein